MRGWCVQARTLRNDHGAGASAPRHFWGFHAAQTPLCLRAGRDPAHLRHPLADAAAAEGFRVERRQVVLTGPIKDLGLHSVSVVLHPEVTVKLTLNVARSTEEAELQASGKSVRELAAEAEAAAEFEIAELFDDIGSAADEDA